MSVIALYSAYAGDLDPIIILLFLLETIIACELCKSLTWASYQYDYWPFFPHLKIKKFEYYPSFKHLHLLTQLHNKKCQAESRKQFPLKSSITFRIHLVLDRQIFFVNLVRRYLGRVQFCTQHGCFHKHIMDIPM